MKLVFSSFAGGEDQPKNVWINPDSGKKIEISEQKPRNEIEIAKDFKKLTSKAGEKLNSLYKWFKSLKVLDTLDTAYVWTKKQAKEVVKKLKGFMGESKEVVKEGYDKMSDLVGEIGINPEKHLFSEKIGPGTSGENVKELSQFLKWKGYYNGNMKENFDSDLQKALISYQEKEISFKKGDGIMDADGRTMKAINKEMPEFVENSRIKLVGTVNKKIDTFLS